MWIDFISRLTEHATFAPPVSHYRLATAEARLGIIIPDELRSLLLESNGVRGEYGLGLIWDIDRIEADNTSFRNQPDLKHSCMPFDHLLFFADAGNGDQFAYPLSNGMANRIAIFAWNHENDSRSWVAPSLKIYLEWWLQGKILL